VTVDRALAGFRPTLVHAATPFGVGLAGRAAALRHGVPLVTSYHTSFAAYAAHYRLGALALPGWRFLRWFHNSGARTYCPSAAIVDEVRQHGFERLAVWSRGIDVSRFSPARRSAALRAQLGVGDDDVLVLYVGRLASEKGLGPALEGARLAAARAPWLRFAFVGDGPFAAAVRSGAPVGSWVPGTLTGDALAAAYASADLFLFPSTTDTFGNVLLEAAASGLPIVAADAGPTRELLAGSGSARLVPPHDPLGLAEALWGFGADAGARGRAGRAARGLAESRDWGQVWGRLFADYRTVLAPSAVRRAA
jgi:glycosyltransferase involved in cell wall biosynthesis